MAAVTDPILLDSTGQEIVEALETIAENMGTSAGHTIQNDSGTDMQRRDKLQFKGVYVEDDQTNDVTKVNICRTMTKAQMEALSGEELKGFIQTSDEPDSLPLTAEWIAYDSNTSVKDKIDDVSNSATYTTSDEINLSDFVALGYLRGNRKRVDFVVPINKDLANFTLALSGTWSLFDLTDNTTLINGEDINATGNSVSITKMNGYLLIQLTRAENITSSRMCGLHLGTGSKITIS